MNDTPKLLCDMNEPELSAHLDKQLVFIKSCQTPDTIGSMLVIFSQNGITQYGATIDPETAPQALRELADRIERRETVKRGGLDLRTEARPAIEPLMDAISGQVMRTITTISSFNDEPRELLSVDAGKSLILMGCSFIGNAMGIRDPGPALKLGKDCIAQFRTLDAKEPPP